MNIIVMYIYIYVIYIYMYQLSQGPNIVIDYDNAGIVSRIGFGACPNRGFCRSSNTTNPTRGRPGWGLTDSLDR